MILTVTSLLTALFLQFWLSVPALLNKGYSVIGAVTDILSYFTILSNLLAAVCLTVLLLAGKSTAGLFFSKGGTLTAVTVYITIVSLVYNVVLRQLWSPAGLFKTTDELLHTVNPLLFIIYWLAFAPKSDLNWRQSFAWLWYPFLYLIYTLVRGFFTQTYPYPFVDVIKLGYSGVMLNCIVLLFVFEGLGLLFVFIGRGLTKTA